MKKAFKEEGEIEVFIMWKKFDKVRWMEGDEVRIFVN